MPIDNPKNGNNTHINTAGGTSISGNVDTSSGDFVGRNKITYSSDIRNMTQVTGDLIIYESHKSVSSENLMKACQEQVARTVQQLSSKYKPELYVKRALEEELYRFLDEPLLDNQQIAEASAEILLAFAMLPKDVGNETKKTLTELIDEQGGSFFYHKFAERIVYDIDKLELKKTVDLIGVSNEKTILDSLTTLFTSAINEHS